MKKPAGPVCTDARRATSLKIDCVATHYHLDASVRPRDPIGGTVGGLDPQDRRKRTPKNSVLLSEYRDQIRKIAERERRHTGRGLLGRERSGVRSAGGLDPVRP